MEEVRQAIQNLKGGKSPGVDYVSSELIKCGGKEIMKALTTMCWKI